MALFTYTSPEPSIVKFNRLVMGLLIITAVFSERIEFLYLFFFINIFTFITTLQYAPTSWIYMLLRKLFGRELCHISKTYERSYFMTKATERFEMTLRILFSGVAIAFYANFPMVTWLMVIFMGIFILISTFFGFCLASLGFIGIRSVKERYFGAR